MRGSNHINGPVLSGSDYGFPGNYRKEDEQKLTFPFFDIVEEIQNKKKSLEEKLKDPRYDEVKQPRAKARGFAAPA